MSKPRVTSKTTVLREVIETENVESSPGDFQTSSTSQGSRTRRTDPDKTVEEIVFGKRILPDGSTAPVYTDWKQMARRQQQQQGRDLNESFRPLASSSFSEPGTSSPVALNLSSPLDISAIDYPQPPPHPHQTTVCSPPQLLRTPTTTPHPFASTTLPGYGSPRVPVPTACKTLPCTGRRPPPTMAAGRPPAGRIAPTPHTGASTSFPRFHAPTRPSPEGNRTIAVSGVTIPYKPHSTSNSQSSSREIQLQQRLDDVEGQLARVALALQGQGIETELSEESQIRLISFLQKRLQDLEAKVAEVEEYSRSPPSDYSMEEDSLERGQNLQMQNRSTSRRESEGGIHDTLFELQDLISRREES